MAILGIAILTDLTSRRIPNLLIVPALSIALIFSVAAGGLPGFTASIGGLGVGLALFLPMYACGVMGAGDVKLLGVAGAFLGPQGALVAGITAFVAGGCFALLWIAWSFARQSNFDSSAVPAEESPASGDAPPRGILQRRAGIPYAPAIAAGAAFAIWQYGYQIPLGLG
ncbi:MAG TPA: prepilin peptidase [Woeseiaceae bacterium]